MSSAATIIGEPCAFPFWPLQNSSRLQSTGAVLPRGHFLPRGHGFDRVGSLQYSPPLHSAMWLAPGGQNAPGRHAIGQIALVGQKKPAGQVSAALASDP